MLDSGSSLSLVRQVMVPRMTNIKPLAPLPSLVTAPGDPLPIRGYIRAQVRIGQLRVMHEFIVVDSLVTPVILGADFLQENNVALDFSSSPVTVFSSKLPSLDSCQPKPSPNEPQQELWKPVWEDECYGTPNATKIRHALAHAEIDFWLGNRSLKIDFGCKNRLLNQSQNRSWNRSQNRLQNRFCTSTSSGNFTSRAQTPPTIRRRTSRPQTPPTDYLFIMDLWISLWGVWLARLPLNKGHPSTVPKLMVRHRNVYLLDLRIKDTSRTDARSSPKRSHCIVNKFYCTVTTTPRSSIASEDNHEQN